MRAVILAFAVTLLLVAFSPAAQADGAEIKGVISSQIDAFKADDFERAFTFASPSIQNIFRTPENFGRMVSNGYPMVWRPAEVSYLDLRMEGGAVFQDVQIVDSDGRTHILEYRMEQMESGWKISGVRILEAPGVAA